MSSKKSNINDFITPLSQLDISSIKNVTSIKWKIQII